MVTHGNIVATAAAVITVIPGIDSKDVYLAYLPLAHVFELAAEVPSYLLFYLCMLVFENYFNTVVDVQSVMLAAGCRIGYGSPLTFTDTSTKIKKGTRGDASALKPTLMAAVPAILDRVRDGVLKKV